MWSGPRNISTALMRSWSSRRDTVVCDEPFYARYLAVTGADHPGRDAIIAAGPTDLDTIVANLIGPVPDGRPIFYQKHMAHHLLPRDDLAWLDHLRCALLIRDPAEMITSFLRVVPEPTPSDLGLPQQVTLLEFLSERCDRPPPVLIARDVLENPRAMLTALCARLGVPFDEAMLAWKPGPRPTDGLWAPHWYSRVNQSTGFAPYRPKPDRVPDHLLGVLETCQGLFDTLAVHRLIPHDAAPPSETHNA